jgi:hypothetical protein
MRYSWSFIPKMNANTLMISLWIECESALVVTKGAEMNCQGRESVTLQSCIV